LASQLVVSLTNSVQAERFEAVEQLLVELKRQNRAEPQWERFAAVVGAAFADNFGPTQEMLQGRAAAFAGVVGTKMAVLANRLAKQERRVALMAEKLGSLKVAAKKAGPVNRSPIRPPRRFVERSPLTPAIAGRTDEMGLTPRLNPSFNMEPPTKKFGWA
jgi:hypothetical protein